MKRFETLPNCTQILRKSRSRVDGWVQLCRGLTRKVLLGDSSNGSSLVNSNEPPQKTYFSYRVVRTGSKAHQILNRCNAG